MWIYVDKMSKRYPCRFLDDHTVLNVRKMVKFLTFERYFNIIATSNQKPFLTGFRAKFFFI
jgi:hypothetical protein